MHLGLQDQHNPKDYADNSAEAIKQREFMAPFLAESLRNIGTEGTLESEFFEDDEDPNEDDEAEVPDETNSYDESA